MAKKAPVTRSAPRRGTCTVCKEKIVLYLRDGLDIVLDAQPINLRGEAASLLAGHQTWHWIEGRMHRRSEPYIRLEPHPMLGTIHRLHHCGEIVADEHKFVPRKPDYDSDIPPF
jgi:hypothetical protein